ncbi:MAG TPA: aldo/keto reductase [Polyangia bacterium]|jgi:aryl-alcohol dehydrogenase-like predicted oxidoreductase
MRAFDRRQALWAGAGLAAVTLGGRASAAESVPKKPQPGAPAPDDIKLPAGAVMPRRKLGRTGVEVSLLGLGGFHIGLPPDEQTAIRIVRMAVDHGVTFMDNCWDYNDGKSQVWMGHALRDGYRDKVFLMTKIDGRTRAAATEQIDQCLKSFGTDTIDLLQVHEVIRDSDPDRVFGKGGAMEALMAAKKAGKIRFIGFTGHKSPAIHLRMLQTAQKHRFTFDTVQMPVNVMDAHYDSFGRRMMPALVKDGIGVLGMKPLGSGLFFQSGPLQDGSLTPTECLHYAMNQPTSVVITGCDTVGVLKQGLDAAYRFKKMTDAQTAAIVAKTAPIAQAGEFEKYKTSSIFDGTAQHPHWLEGGSL